MMIFGFIEDAIGGMFDAINDFRTNPLDSLGKLIPIAIGTVALIGFAIAYIIFIVKGGYTAQVSIFKSQGMDGVEEAFTEGTVHIIYHGIVSIIINVLFLPVEVIHSSI